MLITHDHNNMDVLYRVCEPKSLKFIFLYIYIRFVIKLLVLYDVFHFRNTVTKMLEGIGKQLIQNINLNSIKTRPN